ncbi:transglycosylase domain-containing protein [bacterium]|nr:transglycosylase domain-containing protein [bacterium]
MEKKKVFIWKTVAIVLFSCLIIFYVSGISLVRKYLKELPPLKTLEQYQPNLTTKIYDIEGRLIRELFTERRTTVTLSEIPVDLQNAIIAIEDTHFFKHWGVYLPRIISAMFFNIKAGHIVQGGSTITQQLAKVCFLTRERTMQRKMKEFLFALVLEHKYTKEEILQMYLNQIYFGYGAYGVESAARIYFGKHIQDLNLPECALLAGLPRAPNRYSPFKSLELATRRRSIVLYRMEKLGFITEEEKMRANEHLINTEKKLKAERHASYFIEYIRQQLEPKYGYNVLYKGGLNIFTTLDLEMQKKAEEILEKALSAFDEKKKNEIEKEGKQEEELAEEREDMEETEEIPPVQGALLAIEPQTGQIRTMVGGRDFYKSQFNRAVQAKRQPGSAFKPIIYTAAIDSGYTAASIIEDLPLTFQNDGEKWVLLGNTTDFFTLQIDTTTIPAEDSLEMKGKIWQPGNWDNKCIGPITLRKALSHSRNTCAIRLIYALSPRTVIKYARKLGVDKNFLGDNLSLALGTSVITMMELTHALSTIANGGIKTKPYAIIEIRNKQGTILESNIPQETEVLSAQTAYLVINLLKGVIKNGTGWRAKKLRRPAAGKTGTTQFLNDLWFAGFTPQLVAAVWVGYDDHRSLSKKISSSAMVVPIWTDFMIEALKDKPALKFSIPEGIVFEKINKENGLLTLKDDKNAIYEVFLKGTEPTTYDFTLNIPSLHLEDLSSTETPIMIEE